MRRLVLATLTLSVGLAVPAIVRAQSASETSMPSPAPTTDQAKPTTAQAKPTQPPQATTPPAAAAPTVEVPHSLFDQTWHQFQFGGRLTSIDGDPARFQRYQDVRDGVRRRFYALVDAAGFDEDRARAWVIVRVVRQAVRDSANLTRYVAMAKAVQD